MRPHRLPPSAAPRRRPPAAAAATAVLAVLAAVAAGCEREAALLGSGAIRSVEIGPGGSAYVLRAWRDRTPGSTVLLDVDPATGRAAPILPRLPGRRGATVRTIELAVPRPADVTAGGPTELVVTGPDVGIAVIRGPFTYLGAFPELEIIDRERLLVPEEGPAAAPSPDGRRLLMFAPVRADDDSWTYMPAIVDLGDLTVARADRALPGRGGGWLAGGEARVDTGEGPRRLEPAEDGGLRLAPIAGEPVPAPPAPGWTRTSSGALAVDADDPRPLDWPEPPAGVAPLGPGAAVDALAWTGSTVLGVRIGADGRPEATPLDLSFDRDR